MIGRHDVSDKEWSVIAPLLPNKPRGVARVDDRRVISGIFYILRTGAPWRDLPERYGPPTTVYNRYNRWAKQGVWLRIFERLSQLSPESLHLIDSSPCAPTSMQRAVKRGSGSRHRSLPWRTDHQDPCRR